MALSFLESLVAILMGGIVDNETIALRIALAGLLKAYEELCNQMIKKPDLNLFYRQAKELLK